MIIYKIEANVSLLILPYIGGVSIPRADWAAMVEAERQRYQAMEKKYSKLLTKMKIVR